MDRSRFLQLLPSEAVRDKGMVFAGIGALGSKLALMAAKMGWQIRVVDPDVVDASNATTQAYFGVQVGKTKTEALLQLISLLSGEGPREGEFLSMPFTPRLLGTGGMNCLVVSTDSLKSRQQILEGVLKVWKIRGFPTPWEGKKYLIVDVRMALEELEVYFVYPEELEKHIDTTLKGHDDPAKLPCGATSVPYTGDGAVALIMPHLRRLAVGYKIPHTILADLGSSQTITLWREGEEYVPETMEDLKTRISSDF